MKKYFGFALLVFASAELSAGERFFAHYYRCEVRWLTGAAPTLRWQKLGLRLRAPHRAEPSAFARAGNRTESVILELKGTGKASVRVFGEVAKPAVASLMIPEYQKAPRAKPPFTVTVKKLGRDRTDQVEVSCK